MREHSVLEGMATRAEALMRDPRSSTPDAEVEGQAPAASLVSQVVPSFHFAAPLP